MLRAVMDRGTFHMRKTMLALVGSAAITLAGCGSETSGEFTTDDGETAEYTIDKDSGETSMTVEGPDGTATLRSGADLAVEMPAGFSLFPGSTVLTNTVVNQPDGKGTMVMFESDGTADAVMAHYRNQAEAAGFDIQLEMNTNGSMMIGGERKADGSTMSITATANAGEKTTGQIIIGSKSG